MKIGIIGAGFTGLSAAYYLSQKGHEVTIFEKDAQPGGLAVGYQEKDWEWSLEKHYHHWFTNKNGVNNDVAVFSLAKELHHKIITKRPKTAILVDNTLFQFDSPKNVLLFPKLSIVERLRMAFVVGALRYNPFWKPLEKINANTFLPRAMGNKAYTMIWKPQLVNKFGSFANNVSLAWIWARLVSRTSTLAYPEGGFFAFAKHIVEDVEKKGGKFFFNTEVIEVINGNKNTIRFTQGYGEEELQEFDKIIVTVPSFLYLKLFPQLPENYKKKFVHLNSLGATNLILRLNEPFFQDNTYWLSVCDLASPVMAIVEHTNFMDKKYYNNEHLLYLGNYLLPTNEKYRMTKEEQLKLFDPFLQKINPNYKKTIIGYELFKAPFAQPIIPTNYSKLIPAMDTPLKNVFLANIDQVYPWDRGTSNAIALGKKVANYI